MFSGSIPALVTPFRDGALDERAFRRLVDWQIENGSSALVPCGTTGENSTLSNAEHHRVIEICVEQAAGRVPVIAGCGSNDTMNAALHMTFSKKCGASAALLVAPYYNRPSQAGLLAHFSYLAEHVDLPIILYNVPGRTVTDLHRGGAVQHQQGDIGPALPRFLHQLWPGEPEQHGDEGKAAPQRAGCPPPQAKANHQRAQGRQCRDQPQRQQRGEMQGRDALRHCPSRSSRAGIWT